MFILKHRPVELTREDIVKAAPRAKGRGKTYFAFVNHRKVPVKNLLYEALREKGHDFTLLDFTTADSIRILKKLGIEIRHEVEIGLGESLLKFAGAIELGGNAVEDERRLHDRA